MRVDDFDFHLPEERIALRPVEPRDAARLLVVRPGQALSDRMIFDLPAILRPGDCLVFNNVRVLPAYLEGERKRGDNVIQMSANLIERFNESSWWALARPGKRLKVGDHLDFRHFGDSTVLGAAGRTAWEDEPLRVEARIVDKNPDGRILLEFALAGAELDAALARVGQAPLPPYIASKRPADARDEQDYQTMFADVPGAVAAPTAGLHFTPALMEELSGRGIRHEFVTLYVGAGTFLPVKVDDTDDHVMHSEYGEISSGVAEQLNHVRSGGGRIIPVGTTALRVLETAADEDGRIASMAHSTDIFITPGYRFRATDALMTNFHLPRSTLLMLVAAFSGLEEMLVAYRHAIEDHYRFYSYGDACLLFPKTLSS